MNKIYLCNLAVLITFSLGELYCQSGNKGLTKVSRINILNPGIEYEFPVTGKSAVSVNIGLGLGYPYKALEQEGRGNGFVFMIEPILDLEYKYLYNFNKRINKNKNIKLNSANYIGMRFLTRGHAIADYNMYRPNDFDFAIAPVWGVQRSKSKIYYLMDLGLGYSFDSDNSGVILLVQMSFGISLNKDSKD